MGGFCNESGINLEIGGDHDEYFWRNLAERRIEAIEAPADHR